ncbi:MAG: electron transfer flavoprotein subunit alpha/FixB family protein [Candidatus Thermoplasmatota archaeon]|nr:electron transfer flavoprotein subunit alpha/FixB family protein [Candidatus Thermoplasmatota archaeon]
MVFVFSDNEKIAIEMLAKAVEISRELGSKPSAVVLGRDGQEKARKLVAAGASVVYLAGQDMDEIKAEEGSEILHSICKEVDPPLIMIGSTKTGKEIAPRLASLLDAGLSTDSRKLYVRDGSIVTERIVYSGNGVATERFASKPAIVTVQAKTYDPLPPDDSRGGEIVTKDIAPREYGSKILKVESMVSEGANVEDAQIIVSCGRGFKSSQDLKLIEDLAKSLKGYTLGCSRPIAADLKWLSEDHWIGLSGHKVKPKLYVACGISGQIQHVAGMRDSGIIVAINKDENAPIFKVVDYGIVGDLYTVIPKLVQAINEKA